MADSFALHWKVTVPFSEDRRNKHARKRLTAVSQQPEPRRQKPRFNLYTWLFDNPERFFWVIVSLGLIGGLAALMVPNYIDWQISSKDPADTKAEEIKQKSISDLRLHILYITGGIIAILTLLQNSWKNQIDRRKIEDDIQKNKNDHDRQVRAERRSRYTKAVEQLANEKAAVRLGGIYTLVGLVDEWIADDTLESEEQQKEGQVIINNLCAYIRSPFPLAKNRDTLIPSNEVNYGIAFEEDSVRLREEQETRLSIFTEISNHLTVPEKNSENKENTWNKFSYNYRESLIFYPLGNLKFANPDFSGSEFYGEAVFHNSEFIGESNFTHARFKRSAVFTISRHNCITKFDNAIFHGDTYFIGAEFFSGVSFKNSVYGSRIIFSEDSEKRAKKLSFPWNLILKNIISKSMV